MTHPDKEVTACVNNDRRENDVFLAQQLEEWKHFSIMKFDESTAKLLVIEQSQGRQFNEGTARMLAIEQNQNRHIALLETNTQLTMTLHGNFETLQESIKDVLGIVTALSGTKKTFTWIGKFTLWISSLVGAVTLIKVALTAPIKWPW